jgi:hypothetical protein
MTWKDWIPQILFWIMIPIVWIICFVLLAVGLAFVHIRGYFVDLWKEMKDFPYDKPEPWEQYYD